MVTLQMSRVVFNRYACAQPISRGVAATDNFFFHQHGKAQRHPQRSYALRVRSSRERSRQTCRLTSQIAEIFHFQAKSKTVTKKLIIK